MNRHTDMNGRYALSQDMQSPPSRLTHQRHHAEIDCSPQLQLLEELQDARLKRRKFLEAQVERNLVAEADLVQLASRRRQYQDDGQLSPQEELLSLRETNKALRYKIREKQRLVQSLLKQQQQPGEKSQLQAMIVRNKQYLDEIKRRNQEFKRELEGMYTSDPRREALKFGQLKERLLDYEQQIDEYQREQLKLRQRIDQQRSQCSQLSNQNSQLSNQNQQIKQVLEEYEGELEKCKSSHQQSGSQFDERLTFLLTQNTQIGLRVDQLESENNQLREELTKQQHTSKQKQKDYEKRQSECEQLKQLLKEIREQYNVVLAERDNLQNECDREQQERMLEQEEISNLNIQIKNLEALRQLELQDAAEQRGQTKAEEHFKSKTQVLSLKVEYDSTIRKLTEQNEELMKQLQLVFEMKNRNEEELLKTLKLQEKLERDNAFLEEKVKSVELKGQRQESTSERIVQMKQKLDQIKLENVKLIGERETLMKELRVWEDKWSRKLTDQSSNQKNISVIERDYSDDQQDATGNHELQFLRDELESGNKNMHMLKEQIEMSEHNMKLKSNQVRDLERRIQQLQQELEEEREMRRNIEGKYQESREYNRTKEDEVEELLNKNAKQNQRIYEVSQKCSNLQLKLQEEVAMRSHLLEEQEKLIEEKYREIKNSIQNESHIRAQQEANSLKEQAQRLTDEKESLHRQLAALNTQLNSAREEIQSVRHHAGEDHNRLTHILEMTAQKLLEESSDDNAGVQMRFEKAINHVINEVAKYEAEIDRLKQISQELLNEITIKDKEIEFLVGENAGLKIEAEKALAQIKDGQRLIELEQECTVKVLVDRMEKSEGEVEQLKRKLEGYEKEQQSDLERKKAAREEVSSNKKPPPAPSNIVNGKENPSNSLAHDYLIVLKDLKHYMMVNKMPVDDSISPYDQVSDEGLLIIKSTKEQIRTLLSQNFLLRENNRKLEKQLKCKPQPPPESDDMLLSDGESSQIKTNWQLHYTNLKQQLAKKEEQHKKSVIKLEDYIVSRESEFAQKISQLENQLIEAKAQPIRTPREQSNIAWSDLRDSENLEYSYSTVPRESLNSNLESDNLQNLEDRNEERFEFQNELREAISKYLNLETSRVAQLILSTFSNLFLYPNHDQLLQFLEQFSESIKYYEQYETQKATGMRSTIMEYFGRAEELLDDGDVNLLDYDSPSPNSQLSQKKSELAMHSSLHPQSRRISNSSASSSTDKRSKSKSTEKKKPAK